MLEYVTIVSPSGDRHIIEVPVRITEDNVDIARRLAASMKVGTIIGVSGDRFSVESSSPVQVRLLLKEADPDEANDGPLSSRTPMGKPESVPPLAQPPSPEDEAAEIFRAPDSGEDGSSEEPKVGEVWRPRDPRRKSSFRVVAVNGDVVTTSDGRRIQLARFKRYDRVE